MKNLIKNKSLIVVWLLITSFTLSSSQLFAEAITAPLSQTCAAFLLINSRSQEPTAPDLSSLPSELIDQLIKHGLVERNTADDIDHLTTILNNTKTPAQLYIMNERQLKLYLLEMGEIESKLQSFWFKLFSPFRPHDRAYFLRRLEILNNDLKKTINQLHLLQDSFRSHFSAKDQLHSIKEKQIALRLSELGRYYMESTQKYPASVQELPTQQMLDFDKKLNLNFMAYMNGLYLGIPTIDLINLIGLSTRHGIPLHFINEVYKEVQKNIEDKDGAALLTNVFLEHIASRLIAKQPNIIGEIHPILDLYNKIASTKLIIETGIKPHELLYICLKYNLNYEKLILDLIQTKLVSPNISPLAKPHIIATFLEFNPNKLIFLEHEYSLLLENDNIATAHAGALLYLVYKYKLSIPDLIKDYKTLLQSNRLLSEDDVVILLSIKYETQLRDDQILDLYETVQKEAFVPKQYAADFMALSFGINNPPLQYFIQTPASNFKSGSTAAAADRRW
jgi:hypothetical protein